MSKRKIFGEIPQEISENIKAPETAPSDKRISGRTKQLNFKVREEFYWQLKNRAMEERCMMVEVLEKAFEEYEETKQEKGLEKYRKIIQPKPKKPQKKLVPYRLECFGCDNCGDEYYNEIAYSYAPSLNEINDYQTYCSNCVAE
jgi:hypothetical protein